DAHGLVIDDHGQLVSGNVIAAPDQEITKIHTGCELLLTLAAVKERDELLVRNPETPAYARRCFPIFGLTHLAATFSRITDFIIFFVRSGRSVFEVLAGAGAWVDEAAVAQPAPCFQIKARALILRVRAVSADRLAGEIGTFIPVESQPAEVIEHCLLELRARAMRVQVFIAEHEFPGRGARPLVGHPEGARVSQVQVSGWRRRQAAAVRGHHAPSAPGESSTALANCCKRVRCE